MLSLLHIEPNVKRRENFHFNLRGKSHYDCIIDVGNLHIGCLSQIDKKSDFIAKKILDM